jgi:Fur family transcriptional regulator, ferric uptake regulator
MEAIIDAVTGAGYRLTRPRQAVANLVTSRAGHFTAADLLDDARQARLNVGRATVFRNLELFTELGALERLDLPSGDHAYVACAPDEHHHHVVCRQCGKSADVEDSGLQSVVAQIARTSGYHIESHRLELFGLCPACAA